MSEPTVLPAYSMNRPTFPQMYERSLVEPLFRPWAERMVERAELEPSSRVLDVACGTGIVARLVRRRLGDFGTVVGVDLSAPMLDVARAIEPSVDWRVGNAMALPVPPSERFDRVLCQQGFQFFADRAAAARELHRVLERGGRALVTVWRAVQEMPLLETLQRVAERHVGPINDQRHAFGDDAELARVLAEAGFRDVRVEPTSLVHRFGDGAEFVRMNAMALVGMSNARPDEPERERLLEAIVRDSDKAIGPLASGVALECELRSNFAVANA